MPTHIPLRRFAPAADRGELRVRRTMDSVESYDDREGYDPGFLGHGRPRIELPGLGDWADDVATRTDPAGGHVLDYTHFSTIVCRSRRMPLLSAVNIDGNRTIEGVDRTDIWKRDPRIPEEFQILEECYGRSDEGHFSRGHLTRREDPNWGTEELAVVADADTFHATNAAPQAQSFNSPIWLGLENYLLHNTRDDDMKICVMTGPVFAEEDEEMFGVRIPARFWKVVAFVHDITRRVTCTAYLASQARQVQVLREPQFVFGRYKNWQTSVSAVSTASGLDFSHLEEFDPLQRAGERFALSLDSLDDIYTA